MNASTQTAFRKCGTAHRMILDNGTALWLKRIDGRYSLLWQYRDNFGAWSWSLLGTYSTLAEGRADAVVLLRAEVGA